MGSEEHNGAGGARVRRARTVEPACCGRVWIVALLSVIGCNPITNVDEMVPFRRWVAKPPDTKLGDVVEITELKADEPLMKQLQEAWATAEASRRVVVRLPKEPAQRAILKDQPPGVTAIVLTRTSTTLDLNALDQVPVEAITVEDRAPAIPEAPGWFDVGAGFGVAFNAINRDQDNDVQGIFLSAKAYPGGRWYTHASRPIENGDGTHEVVTVAVASGFEQFLRRWSVSYGFSLSELGDEGVDGAVHHIGVGFDVSPDLAVVAGASFFDLDDALDGGEHDQAFFLGVALNLNAFRYMFSAKPEFTTAAGLPGGR